MSSIKSCGEDPAGVIDSRSKAEPDNLSPLQHPHSWNEFLDILHLPHFAETAEILGALADRKRNLLNELEREGPFVPGSSGLPKIHFVDPRDPDITTAVNEWLAKHPRD